MTRVAGTPQRALTGSTLGFFVGLAAVALIGPAAKRFQEIVHLTPLMLGLLAASPSLSGSLLRIPFGAWVDTTGGRKPLLVLLLMSSLGMSGLTWLMYTRYPAELTINYYWLLFLLGVLSGCGIATFSVGAGQVSYWFPQSYQGRALGTYAGIGNLAPGIFSFLLPVCLISWGLAGSYLAWLIFLVVGTVVYYFIGCNAPSFQYLCQGLSVEEAQLRARQFGQEIFPRGNALQSVGRAARSWRAWVLTVIYFSSFGGFIALTAWLPTYWATLHGQDLKTAGLLTAMFSLTCSLVRVVGGNLSDRLGGEKTLTLSLFVMLAGAFLMSLARTLGLALVAELVMALGMGMSNAAVFKLKSLVYQGRNDHLPCGNSGV